MQTWRAAAIACALGAGLAAAPQNAGSPATVRITGSVVDAATGTPLPNVHISGTPKAVGMAVALTDADGRFAIALRADRRAVIVFKSGYARQEVAASAARPLEIRLERSAAITGRVTEVSGEPLASVQIAILRYGGPNQQAMIDAAVTTTDDRGEYRAGGLKADTYVACLGSPRSRTCFPGTDPTSAERMTLRPGDERAGIDFVVQAPERPVYRSVAAVPTGTGAIRGRVVGSDGRALPGAVVSLAFMTNPSSAGVGWFATSEVGGRFEFGQLPAGLFMVVSLKPGYLTPGPSGSADHEPYIRLASGQISEVTIRLNKLSSVEGRVTDERGDPIEGASIQLLRSSYESGRRTLLPLASSARTDDRGLYRLYNVPPGTYVVAATLGDLTSPDLPGFARTFFPGTPDFAAAQPITVTPGAELREVSLTAVPVRTSRISGRLFDVLGQPRMGGSLVLIPDQGAAVGVTAGARIDPDGAFEFVNVQPGHYLVQMSRGKVARATEGDFAAVQVTVDGADVTDLMVQAAPGSALRGTVSFNTLQPGNRPNAGAVEIVAVPTNPLLAPAEQALADIDRDWNFGMDGITGTRRVQVRRLPNGWGVDGVRLNGEDIFDKPVNFAGQPVSDIEIVLTDRVSVLSGQVTDDRTRPIPGAFVIVYPADRNRWYHASPHLRRAGSDAEGRFTIGGLPGGDYFVAAVSNPPDGPDGWQDPEFLASLTNRAARAMLTEGMTATIRLQLP